MQAGEARGEGAFATLLRQGRQTAGFTQSELAEKAGLSLRAVQHLEGGRGLPYADTARRLADALNLIGDSRVAFEASARRPVRGAPVSASPAAAHAPTSTPLCPRCEAPYEADHQFCRACGASLRGPMPHGDIDGEHKQATVVWCQLDTARLSERLGPEAVLDVLHHLLEEAAEEVGRYEGMLSTVLGDGLVALFGVPQAHEDHARRAVLAALAIQRRLKDPLSFGANPHSRQSARLSDHMRTALHTGWVAVARIGSGHDQRTTAVGETTAFAATIGQAAEPGTIVISDATARQVTGFVRLDPIGPVPVGKGEPVQIYRVTGAGPRRAPLEGIPDRSLSPFVGRGPRDDGPA